VVAAITAGAAVLRLLHIGQVPPDPFYDAAVRSMSQSWHNFFFGVYDPGGSLSIDKPPVDLWLQVIATRLLGFTTTTLKLPEALAGIAAVPLLYVVVRRMWSAAAGVAAAAAMAVLPIAVITSRSDTMDAVMMLVIVFALWLAVRAAETGRLAFLLAAACALGVAFDVKLLESLVALPGLAVFAYLGMPGSRRRRLLSLAAATAVYVVVALSWLTATLFVPAHDRPYAIGSTDGSAWNAAFVFNGTDRLAGKSPEPGATVYEAGHVYPVATQEERDHIPIVPPSPTRLLATVGPLSGERLGLELLVALLLGIPALAWGLLAEPETGQSSDDADASAPPSGTGPAPDAELRRRMRRATAGGLGLWMLTGIALYSHMIRLHPRYVEAFTPVVATMLGIGLAWAVAPGPAAGSAPAGPAAGDPPRSALRSPVVWQRVRVVVLIVTLVVVVYYGERLLYGVGSAWFVSVAAAVCAIVLVLVLAAGGRSGRGVLLLSGGLMAMTLVAVLAIPLKTDLTAIANRVSDAGLVGQIPGTQQRPLSAYLLAHRQGAYYEVASESATAIGSLIVHDARPILVLTSYDGRVFTSIAKLEQLIAQGKVRYAFLNTSCAEPASSVDPACAAPVLWVRAHGTDVSLEAGLPRRGLLYLLPGAKA
jgi:4-amino-4-deoxy-L-arabinose transferase-like glycosyltransferase